MSRLLISCDNTLYSIKGRYYFKNAEWYYFYQRYLRVFDSLIIANRVIEEEMLSNERVLLDDNRIEIVEVPNFSGPIQYAKKWITIKKELDMIPNTIDYGLFRLPSTIGQRVCDICFKKNIPYALEIVYDASDGWKNCNNIFEKLIWKIIDKRMKKSCLYASGVSYVTEKYLQLHYPASKNAFTANYSSLALDKNFYTAPRTYPVKEQYVIAHVANQVMYNGRKGYNQLIDTVGILTTRGYNVKVVFGGPSYNGGIEKLSKYAKSLGILDHVEFVGYLSRNQLSNYLEKADLFVFPTMAEGLPRVVIEAMAKGLPCVTTRVSGNSELIEDEFLVNYGDSHKIADLVEQLITNKDIYESQSIFNFKKSMKYEASVLEKRRDGFYSKLKELQ